MQNYRFTILFNAILKSPLSPACRTRQGGDLGEALVMRILKENTIGLVVDIQERLVPVMEESEQFVENCIKLIQGLQILGLPLLVTQQYTKGLGETIGEIKAVINDFQYIEKKDFSCFDEPVFADKLALSGAKFVIICGIESHVCVLQTAIDLKEAGYVPVVVMDCISSRSFVNMDYAGERFRYEGIMMTSLESVLFELTRSAGTPEFKEISKLVK
jgi:isochorismate hydrolase